MSGNLSPYATFTQAASPGPNDSGVNLLIRESISAICEQLAVAAQPCTLQCQVGSSCSYL